MFAKNTIENCVAIVYRNLFAFNNSFKNPDKPAFIKFLTLKDVCSIKQAGCKNNSEYMARHNSFILIGNQQNRLRSGTNRDDVRGDGFEFSR